jgi:hypothetical protein
MASGIELLVGALQGLPRYNDRELKEITARPHSALETVPDFLFVSQV